MTDTDAVLINTEDQSLICYSFVSLKVCKEGKQKPIRGGSGNTEKLPRWTYVALQRLGERQGKWKFMSTEQYREPTDP